MIGTQGSSIHGELVSSIFNVPPGLSLTGPINRPTVSCGPTPTGISDSPALPLVSSWDDSRFLALSSADMVSSSSALWHGISSVRPSPGRVSVPLPLALHGMTAWRLQAAYGRVRTQLDLSFVSIFG